MNDLLALLGKRIHDLRAAKKWSQEEFAHVSGFHRTYIGQIERGDKNMSFDNLAKVAEALGVTMSIQLHGLEDGATANMKLFRADAGGRDVKETAHRALETQKLVKRLKVQHAFRKWNSRWHKSNGTVEIKYRRYCTTTITSFHDSEIVL